MTRGLLLFARSPAPSPSVPCAFIGSIRRHRFALGLDIRELRRLALLPAVVPSARPLPVSRALGQQINPRASLGFERRLHVVVSALAAAEIAAKFLQLKPGLSLQLPLTSPRLALGEFLAGSRKLKVLLFYLLSAKLCWVAWNLPLGHADAGSRWPDSGCATRCSLQPCWDRLSERRHLLHCRSLRDVSPLSLRCAPRVFFTMLGAARDQPARPQRCFPSLPSPRTSLRLRVLCQATAS